MKFLILILVFIWSLDSFARQFSARMEMINGHPNEVILGEELDLSLIIWPVDNEQEATISEGLFRSDFIEGLHIVEVYELSRADVNYDAIVVRLSGVFTLAQDTYLLKLNDNISLIQIDGFRVIGEDITGTPIFLMVERNPQEWTALLLISFLSLLVIVVISLFVHKLRNKRVLQLKEKKYRERMKLNVQMIEERKEVEDFVENYHEYSKALDLSETENKELINYVKGIQYKKNWSDEENQKIKFFFDELKGQLR